MKQFWYFSWDVKLPVVLDFEIWKASNMLFQNIPRGADNNKRIYDQTSNWNDFWHKSFPEEIEPDMIRPQNVSNDMQIPKTSFENKMIDNGESSSMYLDVSSCYLNQNNSFEVNSHEKFKANRKNVKQNN